jgi:alpha-D-ribose 1-methylphosphonate 5-triphosphate diphosphatase
MGLTDRGDIREGLRADLVQVHMADQQPVIRAVWRRGVRVI